ncbi:hypothetical protein ACFYM0_36210 [Streptomyces sp. NPDC006487]|uniref:hypothetical protein n=1 Tax=Streptomyces sp. NPDC006487 TaxID=3364748 RepID=UPI00368C0199
MRTTYRSLATMAAVVAATAVLGLQTAQAAPSAPSAPSAAPSCAVQTRQTMTTPDHYALTNLRAAYRSDGPKTNAFASYTLVAEPQGCTGGAFFALDVSAGSRVTMSNGSASTTDWRSVNFRVPAASTLVQVMYGDPAAPWNGTYVASAARLLSAVGAQQIQTFSATAGSPDAALAGARRQMTASVTDGRFSSCTEVDSSASWAKVPGRPANGTATVHADCR